MLLKYYFITHITYRIINNTIFVDVSVRHPSQYTCIWALGTPDNCEQCEGQGDSKAKINIKEGSGQPRYNPNGLKKRPGHLIDVSDKEDRRHQMLERGLFLNVR
jgi:hypothetical protein